MVPIDLLEALGVLSFSLMRQVVIHHLLNQATYVKLYIKTLRETVGIYMGMCLKKTTKKIKPFSSTVGV